MNLETQIKLHENPNYIEYLHFNPVWYKILNRYPDKINDFINEYKKNNRLKSIDRINNALSTIEMLQNVLSTLK